MWHTESAMLIEMWERLRGYDKWIQTDAKVESSLVEKTAHVDGDGIAYETYDSSDVLLWADQHGENQRAYFTVPADSPLYQLIGGESISIRYNPEIPDQYYLRELFLTRIRKAAIQVAILPLLIGIAILMGWLSARYMPQ
ncbi:MAG: hypothetical protein ABSF70_02235 [Terracidiphilus sp.]|jgi:hypothetical protein